MTTYRKRLPQIGLPKRILDYATKLEIDEIYSLEEASNEWPSREQSREEYQVAYRKVYKARESLRILRAILRRRYSNGIGNGVYTTNSLSTQYKIAWGKYGYKYGGCLRKGEVLTWVSRDELGNNWFMLDNDIITITGAQIQKIVKIEVK